MQITCSSENRFDVTKSSRSKSAREITKKMVTILNVGQNN